jgi:hypothetical protein
MIIWNLGLATCTDAEAFMFVNLFFCIFISVAIELRLVP